MTKDQARDLAVYAKELFPRSTDAQLAALRDLLMPFPNAQFARQALLSLATETNDLPLPFVRERLEADQRRHGETSKARRESLRREHEQRLEQRRREAQEVERSWQEVDSSLFGIDADELRRLADDVLASMQPETRKLFERADPQTHRGLRSLIYGRLVSA